MAVQSKWNGESQQRESATMSANTVLCHVLGGNVTVVSDLDGNVTNVVCPEFARLTHGCYKKNRELGLVGMIAGKMADQLTGSTRAAYCEFGDPRASPVSALVRR